MFVRESRDPVVITGPTDLTLASRCEFAFARELDARLGRVDGIGRSDDALLGRIARLGASHEAATFARYRDEFGTAVVTVGRPDVASAESVAAAARQTRNALVRDDVRVVYQGCFTSEDTSPGQEFLGFADFLVRRPDGADGTGAGRIVVQDAKLARSAKVTALLQCAAFVEQVERLGVPTVPTIELLLGDGTVSEHRVADILPVYRRRRDRLTELVAARVAADEVIGWSDDAVSSCGTCAHCTAEITRARDVLLVAGITHAQRESLHAHGIRTIDGLAESSDPVDGVGAGALGALRTQARLQLAAERGEPAFEVVAPHALAALPTPSPGDLFFDFEGDPLYSEAGRWGLDYLFGSLAPDGEFTPIWAHDHAHERDALRAFLDLVARRRAEYPDMHIYHYASYERAHLRSLAARHGVGESEVDTLLRAHVLVDLYPLVRRAVRLGTSAYSLKAIEPYVAGTERTGDDVTSAAQSIVEYDRYRALLAEGESSAAAEVLSAIADYNRADCTSTLRVRDWLLGIAREHGVRPVARMIAEDAPRDERSLLAAQLDALAGDPLDERTPDATAAALASAAIDYHRRENTSFWWEHFARLVDPLEQWSQTRDVFVVESVEVEREWFREGRQRTDRRELLLRGMFAPGSAFKAGAQAGPFAVYEPPGPYPDDRADPGARSARSVTVDAVGDGWVRVTETLPKDTEHHAASPSALTPAPPPRPGSLPGAIGEWGESVVAAQPEWPADPVSDLLRRKPPRTRTGALVAVEGDDTIGAVVASLLDLDDSYVAVQGPPGTGKSYLGAHVVATLVRDHRWRVGVVAQSHAVVENLLRSIVRTAGLDADLVGKVTADEDPDFTAIGKDTHLTFASDRADTGFVLGGTPWDLSNPKRFDRRSLDLLVIDEAGQFSLASTIASAVAARNVLMLGDPQQLPQVSQGSHPEPVDESALAWIGAGHDVLPAEFGYFLAQTRRMHPAVTAAVSDLSYAGRLVSHPSASERRLDGIEPGVHAVPIPHRGNATESDAEAAAVVAIVRDALGRPWHDGAVARTVGQHDVIVLAGYNAQVDLVRRRLADDDLDGVRVGTVDKFQGQEAAIAIVTLAASSAADAPRGLSFLLMRNRINVAVSRAQWAAFVVYSPGLLDALPSSPEGMAQLSGFLRIIENAVGS